MICVKCKREVEDGPFCSQCGAKQERTRSASRRANGTGGAYKRGKTWTGRAAGYSYTEIIENGESKLVRRRPTKGGFKTKTEALTWANSYNKSTTASSPTLAELWNGYSTGELTKLSKDKISAYKKARERLEPIIARKIDTLSIAELQAVVNDKSFSYYTARDMKTVLSKLYQRAMAERKAEVNLSQFIVLPALEEKEAVPFSEDEVKKMWTADESGNVFVGYILLLIYTGMMPAELKACKKDMIDRDKCEIWGCGAKRKSAKRSCRSCSPTSWSRCSTRCATTARATCFLTLGTISFMISITKRCSRSACAICLRTHAGTPTAPRRSKVKTRPRSCVRCSGTPRSTCSSATRICRPTRRTRPRTR